MQFISEAQLKTALPYHRLIQALEAGFQSEINVPIRHHHHLAQAEDREAATLLLMPAWQKNAYLGLKLLTVFPENSQLNIPTINGLYLLYSASNGQLLAQMDAKVLTNIRTAASSALASKFLSRTDASHLLILGAGSLLPYLIAAHCSVREIKTVWVWGRDFQKTSERLRSIETFPNIEIIPIQDKEAYISKADIISSATLSTKPLIAGKKLQAGQHLDLIGSYKPHMREADDDCILKSSIFVDAKASAMQETGDLYLPLQKGIISEKDIKADLFDLHQKGLFQRKTQTEITLFKSVGNALEDLVAARLAYEQLRGLS